MPCCGGKQGARPISRLRYLVGSAAILGYHGIAGAVLECAALRDAGFVPVARFHRAFLADLARSILGREGIVLAGDEANDRCAPGGSTK